MNKSNFKFEDLNYKIEINNNLINFIGTIEIKSLNDNFKEYIQKIHEYILNKNFKDIKIDFTKLIFMNSSGIKVIVEWLLKLEELPEEKKYKVLFIYDPKILWQESTINTLLFLNENLLSKKAINQ